MPAHKLGEKIRRILGVHGLCGFNGLCYYESGGECHYRHHCKDKQPKPEKGGD